MANRLAAESSPYLLQHRDNPVDWWPWGPEAVAEAARLDRPIFLSIGYAACHWCHVMAHESFEDEATARLMNERYVNVKVDREELPEVDAVYMNAIQVQGEGGGWPLSAWCTPDGTPYFLGTYFPPQPQHGRPSFRHVLTVMADAWRDQRGNVRENCEALVDGLRRFDAHYRGSTEAAAPADLRPQQIIAAGQAVVERCDPRRGGLRGAPKFPSSPTHALLARGARLPFGDGAKQAFVSWAQGMVRGGIHDHLGGGFARYSVDDRWLVPHFEKMLYDQGQLLSLCAQAYALTGAAEFADCVAATVGFLQRELSDPGGGLWSSLDADSEGEEGKYYVWTPAEVQDVLGPVDALHFCHGFAVSEGGNFEHGRTVLSRVTPRGPASDEAVLQALGAKMLAARDRRVRPGTDDKVLTGWNALAISGLVDAWARAGCEAALPLALRVARFLFDHMVEGDRVYRVYKAGARKLDGTLDDYAALARACLDLAEATGDRIWWQRGESLAGVIRTRFVDEVDGKLVVFLATRQSAALLPHRPESNHDGAIVSGAAVAMAVFVRLGMIAGDRELLAIAERYLGERLAGAAQPGFSNPGLLLALDELLHGEVVVISEGSGGEALRQAAWRAFAPAMHLAGPWAAGEWRAGKGPAPTGEAQAHVCRGQTCSAPTGSPTELRRLLTGE
jgi:uncharacterized protein YyaL (SSP411 family)